MVNAIQSAGLAPEITSGPAAAGQHDVRPLANYADYTDGVEWAAAAEMIGLEEMGLRTALGGGTYDASMDQTKLSGQAMNLMSGVVEVLGPEGLSRLQPDRRNLEIADGVELAKASNQAMPRLQIAAEYVERRSANDNVISFGGQEIGSDLPE